MPTLTPLTRRLLPVAAAAAALLLGSAPASGSTLFTLNGHGWGHGIGMSQYGALGYAQHGWTYQQILGHYYTDTSIGLLPPATTERVLLSSGRPSLHLGWAAAAGLDGHQLAAGSYRVEPGPVAGKLRVWSTAAGSFVLTGLDSPIRITPTSAPLRLDDAAINGFAGDHWWGDFRIIRSGGSLMLVNLVPTEKYVRGVVPCEVPASWLAAAVRTQAVAARSYAVATRGGGDFDAYPDTRSQMYCPIERQAPASDAAVDATRRQVVMYSGNVAVTYFSSSSGGRTSSLSASWGSPDQPYLQAVNDRYDGAGGLNPNHTWGLKRYGPGALGQALGLGHAVGSLDHDIDGPSQRVLSLVAHSGSGDDTLSGATVQSRMGLRSTYFRLLQVTLSAKHAITAGDTLQLSGRLWPKPQSPFHLDVKMGDGSWQQTQNGVSLGADGRFTTTRTPVMDVAYRLVRNGAFSPVVHVHVGPRMTLASKGGFHGTMFPRLQGATVLLQKHGSGHWTTVGSAMVSATGVYHFSSAVRSGSWRARFPGDADHSASTSPVLVVA